MMIKEEEKTNKHKMAEIKMEQGIKWRSKSII